MLNIIETCENCGENFKPVDSDQKLCFECEEQLEAIAKEENYYEKMKDFED